MDQETLYKNSKKLFELGEDFDLSYNITSNLVQRFSKASQFLFKKGGNYLGISLRNLKTSTDFKLAQEKFNRLVSD
ncbi:hypothetical protein ACFLZF_00425, partial [Nanoarchaeota archaeon]